MSKKHTPTETPWKQNPDQLQMITGQPPFGWVSTTLYPLYIVAQTGLYTSPTHVEAIANAALIVEAVNLHEAFLKLEAAAKKVGFPEEWSSDFENMQLALRKISNLRADLAKQTGEK